MKEEVNPEDVQANLTADNLATLTPDGEKPRSRLTSAANGRALFLQDVRNYAKRSQRNALVAGIIDGNPPLSQAALMKAGQGARANFNTGEGQAFMETAVSPFYDLSTEVETFATVRIMSEDPETVEKSHCVQDYFQELLTKNEDHDYNLQLSLHEMVAYGMGPMVWDDDLNWQSQARLFSLIRVPPRTKASVNQWDHFSLEYYFTVGEMYQFIADPEAATAMGWDVEAVKEAIMNAGSGMSYLQGWNQWEQVQRMLRDNEYYYSVQVPTVRVARILVKEFADKDGNCPVTEGWVAVEGTSDKWLFRKDRRYERMSQVIAPHFYDRGNGDVNSIKGLGVKMYGLLLQVQRSMMATVDGAYLNSTSLFQSTASVLKQNLEIMHAGPATIIPNSLNFVQRNTAGVMEPLFAVRKEMQNTLSSNLSQYRQRQEKESGNPASATEINARLQQASLLGKTAIARYYEQRDHWFQETFRRAINPSLTASMGEWAKQALEFQKKCKEDGVTQEMLNKAVVRATRTAGQGSSFLRTQALLATLQILGGALPPDGLLRLHKDILASIDGQAMVERYLPSPDMRPGEQENVWEATMENSAFHDGADIPVTTTQMDEVHMNVHFNFLDAAAGTVPQGADPAEVLKTLQAGGSNITKHLQKFAANPLNKQKAKMYAEHLHQLGKTTDQLANYVAEQAQKAAEEQQRAQQIQQDPELAIKQAEAAQNMQLKQAKTEQQLALKQQNHDARLAQNAQRAAQSAAIKDAQTAQAISLNNAKAVADLALKSKTTEATIQEKQDVETD